MIEILTAKSKLNNNTLFNKTWFEESTLDLTDQSTLDIVIEDFERWTFDISPTPSQTLPVVIQYISVNLT